MNAQFLFQDNPSTKEEETSEKRCLSKSNLNLNVFSSRTHLAPHEPVFPLYKELVMRRPAELFVTAIITKTK